MIFAIKHLRRWLVVAACCCLYAPQTFSQVNAGLVFPSANNHFLGTPGSISTKTEVGVELYTGTLQANIPICELAGKDLPIPVTLNYVSGRGIKVQQYASFVGLGWQLNAGGGISRVVRAFPDEQSNGYLGSSLNGQKVVANRVNGTALPAGFTSTPPTADGEPDIFYIKTPYFSAQFSFDENGNAVFSNTNGLKIIPHIFANSTAGLSAFEVIDEAGTRYYFGSSTQSIERTSTTVYGTSYNFPVTWYLDKIVTFNEKETITLNYMAAPANDPLYHYVGTYTWDIYGNVNVDTTHPVISTISPPRYVSSIVTATGQLDFNYAFDRLDDPRAARLVTIVLRSSNPATVLDTYTFNYGYFGSPSTDPNKIRLKLDNITVTGNASSTIAPLTLRSFTYDESHSMGPRRSLAYADHWGYLNFVIPMQFRDFPNNYRDPAITPAQLGILKSIKELTGSTWEMTYELNDYYNTTSGANVTVGGLRVNKLAHTLPTGENLYNTYSYLDANGRSTGQIFSKSYNIIGFTWGNPGVISQILSESPSEVYDLNGNFVGYSSVKVTAKNGGYSVATFSNFNDFPDLLNYLNTQNQNTVPDVTSSISYAFKRGLPLSTTVYNAAGNKITEDLTPLTAYSSLTSPSTKSSWAYKWNTVSYNVGGSSGYNSCNSVYYTPYENYRLITQVHRDYDQITPANYTQTTTTYGYSTANLRLIKTITTTDSKGNSYTQTFYHPDDANIPMVTSAEQSAITALVNANNLGTIIHQQENRNGTIHQVHSSYGLFTAATMSRVNLNSTDMYAGNTLLKQKFYSYDQSTSNLVSTRVTGGQPTSYLYGYNSTLPIASVFNAQDVYTTSVVNTTQNGAINNGTTSGSSTFTTSTAGDIVLSIYSSPGYTYSLSYTLSGAASRSGTLCAARTSTTCSYPETVTLTNMPAGTYSLSISLAGGNSPYVGIGYNYSGLSWSTSVVRGSYYEGFENNTISPSSNAHSGRYYSTTGHTVNFTIPDSRSYILQWWSWADDKWTMHEQPYTGPVTVPGVVDDIRVFPKDGFMTNYAYIPQVGKTGVIDARGLTTSYFYDGLNRLSLIRDNDNNIVSRICNTYTGQTAGCPAGTVYSNVAASRTFTRNNCATGYQGGTVTYAVAAGKYTSTVSQSDANQLAQQDITANGQAYANVNGDCKFIYKNQVQSGNFTRNNCSSGFTGSTVTYTVPEGRYTSVVSQQEANQAAINDVNNNGQTYANTNGACTSSQVLKYGSINFTGSSGSASFTSTLNNNITITVNGDPSYTYTISYYLTGAASRNGSLCASRSSVTCSYGSSVTLTNMPAGTYNLSIQMGSGSASYKSVSYSYYGAP
jgi:YD repeat-containing protein